MLLYVSLYERHAFGMRQPRGTPIPYAFPEQLRKARMARKRIGRGCGLCFSHILKTLTKQI